jgi:hypothetical protein
MAIKRKTATSEPHGRALSSGTNWQQLAPALLPDYPLVIAAILGNWQHWQRNPGINGCKLRERGERESISPPARVTVVASSINFNGLGVAGRALPAASCVASCCQFPLDHATVTRTALPGLCDGSLRTHILNVPARSSINPREQSGQTSRGACRKMEREQTDQSAK